jgi:chromosome segregation ATPase
MMTSPQPSESADLAKQRRELSKWRKELDEREREVSDRESRLDTSNHELQQEFRLLEGKVLGKKEQLLQIERDIAAKTAGDEAQIKDFKRKSKVAESESEAAVKLALDRKSELKDLAIQVRILKTQLKDLKDAERKQEAYVKDQDKQIELGTKAAQDRMAELNREVGKFEHDKEDLLTQSVELRANIQALQNEQDEASEQLTLLKERYDVTVIKYRSELASIREETQELLESKQSVEKDFSEREERIKVRTHELDVRTDVLNKQADKLEGERRKLESQKAMFGVV